MRCLYFLIAFYVLSPVKSCSRNLRSSDKVVHVTSYHHSTNVISFEESGKTLQFESNFTLWCNDVAAEDGKTSDSATGENARNDFEMCTIRFYPGAVRIRIQNRENILRRRRPKAMPCDESSDEETTCTTITDYEKTSQQIEQERVASDWHLVNDDPIKFERSKRSGKISRIFVIGSSAASGDANTALNLKRSIVFAFQQPISLARSVLNDGTNQKFVVEETNEVSDIEQIYAYSFSMPSNDSVRIEKRLDSSSARRIDLQHDQETVLDSMNLDVISMRNLIEIQLKNEENSHQQGAPIPDAARMNTRIDIQINRIDSMKTPASFLNSFDAQQNFTQLDEAELKFYKEADFLIELKNRRDHFCSKIRSKVTDIIQSLAERAKLQGGLTGSRLKSIRTDNEEEKALRKCVFLEKMFLRKNGELAVSERVTQKVSQSVTALLHPESAGNLGDCERRQKCVRGHCFTFRCESLAKFSPLLELLSFAGDETGLILHLLEESVMGRATRDLIYKISSSEQLPSDRHISRLLDLARKFKSISPPLKSAVATAETRLADELSIRQLSVLISIMSSRPSVSISISTRVARFILAMRTRKSGEIDCTDKLAQQAITAAKSGFLKPRIMKELQHEIVMDLLEDSLDSMKCDQKLSNKGFDFLHDAMTSVRRVLFDTRVNSMLIAPLFHSLAEKEEMMCKWRGEGLGNFILKNLIAAIETPENLESFEKKENFPIDLLIFDQCKQKCLRQNLEKYIKLRHYDRNELSAYKFKCDWLRDRVVAVRNFDGVVGGGETRLKRRKRQDIDINSLSNIETDVNCQDWRSSGINQVMYLDTIQSKAAFDMDVARYNKIKKHCLFGIRVGSELLDAKIVGGFFSGVGETLDMKLYGKLVAQASIMGALVDLADMEFYREQTPTAADENNPAFRGKATLLLLGETYLEKNTRDVETRLFGRLYAGALVAQLPLNFAEMQFYRENVVDASGSYAFRGATELYVMDDPLLLEDQHECNYTINDMSWGIQYTTPAFRLSFSGFILVMNADFEIKVNLTLWPSHCAEDGQMGVRFRPIAYFEADAYAELENDYFGIGSLATLYLDYYIDNTMEMPNACFYLYHGNNDMFFKFDFYVKLPTFVFIDFNPQPVVMLQAYPILTWQFLIKAAAKYVLFGWCAPGDIMPPEEITWEIG